MKLFKKKMNNFPTPYTVSNAVRKGGTATRLTMLVLGLGHIVHKQIVKGLLFLASEVLFLWFMITSGSYNLKMMVTLGELEQQEVWNEAKGYYEYVAGDNSLLILLYGVVTIFIVLWFIVMWRASMKSAYQAECYAKEGRHLNSIREDIRDLFDKNLHRTLLSLPVTGILVLNIVPLIFMILMAFTSYSKDGDHLVLFDWVGLANFKKVLSFSDSIGQTFWSVLGWTLIWAVFATGLNYILGMLLALLINRKGTRFKSFWRFCFILSIAVPQFVSLLIMKTMLQPSGAVNTLLMNMGIINKALPFFTNATWARVTVIVINLGVGIPYTMMQVYA